MSFSKQEQAGMDSTKGNGQSSGKRNIASSDQLEQFKIPMLREDNFALWKMMIYDLLRLKGLWHVMSENPEATEAEMLRTKLTILSTIEPKQAQHVQHCDTPRAMLQTLNGIYDDKHKADKGRLLKKFFNYQLDQNDSMSIHISKMEFLRSELTTIKQPITNEMFIMQLLSTLPPAYDSMKDIWEATDPERKTVKEITSRILSKEEDLSRESEGVAFAAKSRFESIAEKKKRTKCAKCGQKGHWARECEAEPDDHVHRGAAKFATTGNDKSLSF